MMAQRYQMRPDEYALVVTEGQFTMDVLAWFESFSTPLRMLLPSKKGATSTSTSSLSKERYGTSEVPSAYAHRVRPGANVRFVDLDELDTPETTSQIERVLGPSGLGLSRVGRDAYESLLKRVAEKGRSIDARKVRRVPKRAVEAGRSAP